MRCEHSRDGQCHPDCECDHVEDVDARHEEQQRQPIAVVTASDDRLMELVQRTSTTLADLYRKGRAKGLLTNQSNYG